MSSTPTTALLVRMRPISPWRAGPTASGLQQAARERVDTLYHSDSLYSAITNTLRLVDANDLPAWLAATARNPEGSSIRFSSAFPLFSEHLLVVPPRSAWPPPPSAKTWWRGARYVPLSVIPALLAGQPMDDEQWTVDGASGCVVPTGQGGPFRTALRSGAAVDRLNGNAVPHASACLEFQSGGALWFVISFADDWTRERWEEPLKTAIRLLADSGFGGERGQGWGRTAAPSFTTGELPGLILPGSVESDQHWLLSLYSPAESDSIDWSKGNYSTVERGGWVDSPVQSGAQKKRVRMIEEGSVLTAPEPPAGRAPDVAPDGFPHPVFRAGFALSIPLPAGGPQ